MKQDLPGVLLTRINWGKLGGRRIKSPSALLLNGLLQRRERRAVSDRQKRSV